MNEPTSERSVSIQGLLVPRFFYGTAWKENQTQRLTEFALKQGFRGIDTANQRRHYDEAAVGQAIATMIGNGVVGWDEVFLQTKFTFRSGQDNRQPYDPRAPIAIQVEQSFFGSLQHFGTGVLDSYLLHGPTRRAGLSRADWEAWHAMEAIHDSGRVRMLGISNVTLEQVQRLYQEARVKPQFVQNRCYAAEGWDRKVRTFCATNGLLYQGFSLLTANREVLASPNLERIAKHHCRTVSQIVFRFALDVNMIPLTGTTDGAHMKADLDIFDFSLEPDDVQQIENLAAE